MVAQNPLFHGRWTVKKFNATVINDIWPEVFFFSLVATMVCLVSDFTSANLGVSPQLLTVLGTVLGLVISFRTSSAYERYQDGRKMWTNIETSSRNIAQMIWIHVPNQRLDKDNNPTQTELQSIIEKKSMINLVQAFSVSLKHYLRGENGVYFEDLYPLISFLPRYANGDVSMDESEMMPLWHASEDGEHPSAHGQTPVGLRSMSPSSDPGITTASSLPLGDKTLVGKDKGKKASWFSLNGGKKLRRTKSFDPEKALPDVHVHRPLKPARNPPKNSLYDYIPLFLLFKWIFRQCMRRATRAKPLSEGNRNILGRKRKPQLGDSNVPLEIMLYLSNYVAFLLRGSLLAPAVASAAVNNLTMMQDTMSNLERIASTPLPFAYQTHLRMSLWLYLLLLPFQVYEALGYLTIVGTAFASFLLLGFLEIGQEIENPFNYDMNDLDLDGFCLAIQRELHEITVHTQPAPADFIFSMWNQPFAPADRRGADVLSKLKEYDHPQHGSGMGSVRKTLLKSWKTVDVVTRQQ